MSDILKFKINSLEDFYSPVEERSVYFGSNADAPIYTPEYKSLVNPDTGNLICVQSDTYRLVRNKDLIERLLDTIEKTNVPYTIDNSHSFCSPRRMKLALTFPDLEFEDDESKSKVQLHIHNSYDSSEGIRIIWGAIRMICTNGMVLGHGIEKLYRKHTQGFNFDYVKNQMDMIYSKLPEIADRIKLLEQMAMPEHVFKSIEKGLGQTITKSCGVENLIDKASMWQVYNILSYYISHNISLQMRSSYQMRMSKIFNF